jgi:hypothetical protein
MSFVKTLATLAAGFAAAKGVEQYKKMGGMAGLKDTLDKNDTVAAMTGQMDEMFAKMGMPDAGKSLRSMFDQMGSTATRAARPRWRALAG